MARLFATEAAERLTADTVQIHGGYGCVNERPVERYLGDTKVGALWEGTSEILQPVIALDQGLPPRDAGPRPLRPRSAAGSPGVDGGRVAAASEVDGRKRLGRQRGQALREKEACARSSCHRFSLRIGSRREPMTRLPKWVVSNRVSVEREAAPYRGMSAEDRWRATAAACRSAARQLAGRPDRERILDYRDPLPVSTIRILRRLRRAASRAA
jgi:hypothetical protein